MTQGHLYWYCLVVTTSRKGASSKAVLLSPIPIGGFEIESFSALLLDDRSIVPAMCHLATITEFASGRDEHGNPVTFYDGEAYYPDLAADAIAAAQNQITLHLVGNTLPVGRPALISTDENVAFVRRPVVVDLLCMTLAELPDFGANIIHIRSFEESLRDKTMPPPPTSSTDELQAYGRQARLSPGLVLPVNHPSEDGEQVGAVVLDSQLAASAVRYSGHIFMFHRTWRLEAGAQLSRRVTWGEGADQQTLSRPVVRIVSIGGSSD